MFILAFAEGGGVQLIPDFSMFIHMIIILVMIWILNRTFFRPINQIIESREKNKGGKFSKAEGILEEVAEKQNAYKKGISEAREEGYKLIEQERSEALALKQTKIAEVRREVDEKMEKEISQLESDTVKARAEIAEEADKMADRISSNILKTA